MIRVRIAMARASLPSTASCGWAFSTIRCERWCIASNIGMAGRSRSFWRIDWPRIEPAVALLDQTDCLVPIPLHPIRQWTRGYNQAAVIAERIAKQCRNTNGAPLVRLRNTQTQTTLHAQAKRMENLRDAFGLIDAKSVRGRHRCTGG
jgi:predicted amidophosphoribosyltransferase